MKQRTSPTDLSPEEYVSRIASKYLVEGDPVRAEGQMRYMRNQFAFYGLRAPEWVRILRDIFSKYGRFYPPELFWFVSSCYESGYREMHYSGLQMLEKQINTIPEEGIEYLEEYALTSSWWDTVDWLAKLIGIHFRRFPPLQRPTAERWSLDENIWLRRLSMIHQLQYREATDEQLLFEMVLAIRGEKEFFLQKGAGWALRQYSKTNARAVRTFVSAHPELSPLTRREALKWLRRQD